MKDLTIGEVSRQSQVPSSTIRYYESIGLLPLPQRISKQRRYKADVVRRLSFIKVAQQAGFTIAEIKLLLEGFGEETPPLSQWRILARQKLDEVEMKLKHIQQMKHLLEQGLRCGCLNYDECYTFI